MLYLNFRTKENCLNCGHIILWGIFSLLSYRTQLDICDGVLRGALLWYIAYRVKNQTNPLTTRVTHLTMDNKRTESHGALNWAAWVHRTADHLYS